MPKRVKEPTAWSNEDGTITVVNPETLYADDHPLVKARPNLFVEAWDENDVQRAPSARARKVEQATAAPGEERNR